MQASAAAAAGGGGLTPYGEIGTKVYIKKLITIILIGFYRQLPMQYLTNLCITSAK